MTKNNLCFYFQNQLIQTSQTGGQQYSDTSPFRIPWLDHCGSDCQWQNTQAYRDTETITAVKSFTIESPAQKLECDMEKLKSLEIYKRWWYITFLFQNEIL
jgi:hypothetical protein